MTDFDVQEVEHGNVESAETATPVDAATELDRIVEEHLRTMLSQPIAWLLDDSVGGYEALARGPDGSPLDSAASAPTPWQGRRPGRPGPTAFRSAALSSRHQLLWREWRVVVPL